MRIPPTFRALAGRILPWKGILGLTYHRIGDGRLSVFDRGLWSATTEDFERQIRYLKANFELIVPDDIPEAMRGKNRRHILITFDDGYLDNYTEALPALVANQVRATFFVTAGFIDSPRLSIWDEIAWMVRTSRVSQIELPGFLPEILRFDEPNRERAVQALLRTFYNLPGDRIGAFMDHVAMATGSGRAPPTAANLREIWMTWDHVREMASAGMVIGGHTVSHPVMSKLTRAEQWDEIASCKQRILEELHLPMGTFAYPFGLRSAFNDDSKSCLNELGVKTAFSYYGGIRAVDEWDNYDIPRIGIEQYMSLDEFRATVLFPWGS